ncbi:MAG TPA: maleylpyruvate isomerase N-terminal domain-containing protein [Tetrasphaera sp.]|nr:maleylpyruvate isomerase N-terminal domain-containing protein [Tetrasphaera sp.]
MTAPGLAEPFLAAAEVAAALLAREEVRVGWDAPSALPRMTIGMLACHLGRQFIRSGQLLSAPATDGADLLGSAREHYRRASWVKATSLDDPAMTRDLDTEDASAGFDAMLERCLPALAEVTSLLRSGTAHDPVTIPWQGWSRRQDDYLLTRLVEIVVHSDDLAHSIGAPTPEFPSAAYDPVLHLLADLAAERHGQSALVSALTRRERMPGTISAF